MIGLFVPQSGCPCCAGRMPLAPAPAYTPSVHDAVTAAAQARPRFVMPRSAPLLLEGGTVVDPRDGSLHPGMSVFTDAGRIVAVGSAASVMAQPGAQRIDLTGKYIVPGYNDMHTHVFELPDPAGSLALMLAEGVTGVRQMSGSPELLAQRYAQTLPLRKESPALLELPGSLLTPMNATSPEAVTAEIKLQKQQGADFIKAGVMSAPVFRAALETAARVGIKILGHLQDGLDAAEASDLGFRSIEHLGPGATVWAGCSSDEDTLRRQAPELPPMLRKPPPRFLHPLIKWRLQTLLINPAAFLPPGAATRLQHALDTYSETKCQALAQRFVRNDTWHCPTLVRLRTQQLADAPEYENHPDLRYMPKAKISKWRSVTQKYSKLPEHMRKTYREAYPRALQLTKTLVDAGVKMITGSDGGWLSNPGLTLQEEFIELGKAGITPLQVLQMTTINAAEYLGRTSTMGTVQAGRNADCVVLDANPLEHIENFARIFAVVRAGHYYPRKELEALKDRVAANRGQLP